MLYESSSAFLAEPNKRITLMGMSNVGKTRLASLLPRSQWFHYSVDYRLATAHLREPMLDIIKLEMMKNPRLAQHLRDSAISIDVRATFANFSVVSNYLGKLGDPAKGGLSEAELRSRHARHREAEIASIMDIPSFIARGHKIYGYAHFLNDASGSLCEIIDVTRSDDPVLKLVTDNTMLVYIEADERHEERLVESARRHPKPLYYRPEFLTEAIGDYLAEAGLDRVEAIDPDTFVRWIFGRLLAARRPRYAAIARHGYTVSAHEVAAVQSDDDFIALLGTAIDRKAGEDSLRAAG